MTDNLYTSGPAIECGDVNVALRRALIERGVCPECGRPWLECEGIRPDGSFGCTTGIGSDGPAGAVRAEPDGVLVQSPTPDDLIEIEVS